MTFKEIADELVEIQAKKNADYDNAYAKDIIEFGWTGAIIPINHKVNRLKKLIMVENPMVKEESIEDTLLDLAGYALMAVQFIRNNKK